MTEYLSKAHRHLFVLSDEWYTGSQFMNGSHSLLKFGDSSIVNIALDDN